MASNCPISTTRLRQISNDACDSALSSATSYAHASTQQWNNDIINSILKSLISESQSTSTTTEQQPQPRYKFCVNSTIIQHLSDPRPGGSTSTGASATPHLENETEAAKKADLAASGVPTGEGSGSAEGEKKVGRRGMHSASGAYWNNEKDGMWSHKYEAGEGKGMDIVVSVMWIAV